MSALLGVEPTRLLIIQAQKLEEEACLLLPPSTCKLVRTRAPRIEQARRLAASNRNDKASQAATALFQQADAIYWQVALGWKWHGVRSTPKLQRFDKNDRIQWVLLGLYNAARRFDPTRGISFATYSAWWVRAIVYREMIEGGYVVRFSRRAIDKLAQYRQTVRAFPGARDEENAARLQVSLEQFYELKALEATRNGDSLDEPLYTEGTSTLHDVVAQEEGGEGEDSADRFNARVDIGKILFLLETDQDITPREREVLAKCFGLDGTDRPNRAEVGKEIGLSRERVRQIEGRGLAKMRENVARFLPSSPEGG